MAILLCTDDMLIAIPESLLQTEASIEKRFKCRERKFLPADFKGIDIMQEGAEIVLSQMAYLDTKGQSTATTKTTKPDLLR